MLLNIGGTEGIMNLLKVDPLKGLDNFDYMDLM